MIIEIVTVNKNLKWLIPKPLNLVVLEENSTRKCYRAMDNPSLEAIVTKINTIAANPVSSEWDGITMLMTDEDYYNISCKLVTVLESQGHSVKHTNISCRVRYDTKWYTEGE